jgi:hypothetical protein
MERKMLINYLIAGGFLVAGLLLLRRALSERARSRKAQNWPSVTGTIQETDVEEDRNRSATGRATISFVPTLRYNYVVAGKSYEGNRILFGSIGLDYLSASNIRDSFAVGSEVPVFYDPANPQESVLRPKLKMGMFSLIPGVFMLSLSVIVLIFQAVF